MKKSFRARTCVICKNKFDQNELNRYCSDNSNIIKWKNRGRSFYVCSQCLQKDAKIIHRSLAKFIKNIDKISQAQLKEKLING